jgi:hypothetical protein
VYLRNVTDIDTWAVEIIKKPVATIGDFVWQDLDKDGKQDVGEPGIKNVIVKLLDVKGTVIASTTTDAKGFYQFTDLAAGSYTVGISCKNFVGGGVLKGWQATADDQGSNETLDSDGDPITHRSDLVVLAAGTINADTDFGFYVPSCGGHHGKGNNGVGNGFDPQPPGNPPINDGEGTAPGHPGNKGGVKGGKEPIGVSGVGPGENCSPRGVLDSAVGSSKAPGNNPSPPCTLVFNATTGDFQAPPTSNPLASLVEFQLSPGKTGTPAPQPGSGSGAPIAPGETKGAINWAGSYGVAAAPATIPGPTTGADKAIGLTEVKGNGTNGTGKIPVTPLAVGSSAISTVAPTPGNSGKKK